MDDTASKKIKKKLLGQAGSYKIYLVDDALVRGSCKEGWEFSDYGVNLHHRGLPTIDFSFIPENEIWLAKSVAHYERHFILDSVVLYIKYIEAGLSAGGAYDKVILAEKKKRKKELLKKLNMARVKEAVPHIYAGKYAEVKEGAGVLKIFLIRGEVARALYKTDFVEAGHGYVYKWIPKNEIWVDMLLKPKEMPVVILHELVERLLMRDKKFSYAKAHPIASRVEAQHRGNFSKKDVLNLAGSLAF